MKLEIIIASTRPGRIGDQVGKWIAEYAAAHSPFEVAIADLVDFHLPVFDEPNHPMTGIYENEHTKAWSKRIGAADAFIVVTPEYNFNMPPSLLNAIDYLHTEWKYKPLGFVGYGAAGAIRAIQAERLAFVTLSVMPIAPMVNFVGLYAPLSGPFSPEEKHEQAADKLLTELYAFAEALLPLRRK